MIESFKFTDIYLSFTKTHTFSLIFNAHMNIFKRTTPVNNDVIQAKLGEDAPAVVVAGG